MTAGIRSIFFSIVLLASCAHQQPADTIDADTGAVPAPNLQVSQAGNYWWYARFKMDWGDRRRADFSQNLIVAHEVISPLLVRYSDEIDLWRFHRRASHDKGGHQFSFIFYTTPEAARRVFEYIGTAPVVERLLDSGDLLKLILDDPDRPQRASIAATSDPNWPDSIQNSWPYFIMGVSLMWLDLLEQTIDPDEITSRPGISVRLDYYREVNDELTALWKRVGRHAMFHHINAIYGYEALEVVF